mmetsp:Transcript_119370/g.370935  ORF Transcript_119370/g.370935 Transcript_119370/m.370935 type:complete len:208 (-) Transcript_119370:102-725(-)
MPLLLTAARTIARSARKGSATCAKARPSFCTAAKAMWGSARKASCACRSAWPLSCTADSTASLLSLNSWGAACSNSPSLRRARSHSTSSSERRSNVNSKTWPMLPQAPLAGKALRGSMSWHSAMPAKRRCCHGGTPISSAIFTFTSPTLQEGSAAKVQTLPSKVFTLSSNTLATVVVCMPTSLKWHFAQMSQSQTRQPQSALPKSTS